MRNDSPQQSVGPRRSTVPSPLLSRGGVAARIKKKPRSDLSPRRRGGVGQQPKIFLTNTTPSAPARWLRDIFIDVASTPPRLRRGVLVQPALRIVVPRPILAILS